MALSVPTLAPLSALDLATRPTTWLRLGTVYVGNGRRETKTLHCWRPETYKDQTVRTEKKSITIEILHNPTVDTPDYPYVFLPLVLNSKGMFKANRVRAPQSNRSKRLQLSSRRQCYARFWSGSGVSASCLVLLLCHGLLVLARVDSAGGFLSGCHPEKICCWRIIPSQMRLLCLC